MHLKFERPSSSSPVISVERIALGPSPVISTPGNNNNHEVSVQAAKDVLNKFDAVIKEAKETI
jgi:hypothetical protein